MTILLLIKYRTNRKSKEKNSKENTNTLGKIRRKEFRLFQFILNYFYIPICSFFFFFLQILEKEIILSFFFFF